MDPTDILERGGGRKKRPMPPPNISVRMSGTETDWTEEEIKGIICNPIYAGVGPFPACVSDEVWVRSAATLIANEGAEQFLVNLLQVLRSCFPTDSTPTPNASLKRRR